MTEHAKRMKGTRFREGKLQVNKPKLGPDYGEFNESVIGWQAHAFPYFNRLFSDALLQLGSGNGGPRHSAA